MPILTSTSAGDTHFQFSAKRQLYAWALVLCWLLAAPHPALAQTWQAAVAVPNATVRAVAVGTAGDVYVTGFFAGSATFGTTTLTTTSASDGDLFVAKWSGSGWAWAVSGGGSAGNDGGQGIAVSGGSVYVGGRFTGTATFGGTTFTGSAANASNPVVLKYADQGSSASQVWAVGGSSATLQSLAVSGSSIYVAGYFLGQATLGSATLTSAGANDVFVARYTDQGSSASLAWATRDGTAADEYAAALAVGGGSVYVAGGYSGATILSGKALSFSGTTNGFVAKYADQGTALGNGWAAGSGGTSLCSATGLALSGSTVYAAGTFRGTATVAGTALASTSANQSNVFLAKYLDQGSAAANGWATSAGGNCNSAGLAVSGSSLFATGYFVTQATFGPTTLTQAQPGVGSNVFVARYADLGGSASAIWAAGGGDSGSYVMGQAVAVASGGVYVGGTTSAGATFGSLATPTDGGLLARLSVGTATATSQAAAGLAGLLAYPVPAGGRLTVARPPGTVTGAELLNTLGQVVARPALPTPETMLDLSNLPPGIYQLRLTLDGQPLRQRLVLE